MCVINQSQTLTEADRNFNKIIDAVQNYQFFVWRQNRNPFLKKKLDAKMMKFIRHPVCVETLIELKNMKF